VFNPRVAGARFVLCIPCPTTRYSALVRITTANPK
jgi:hypothetical protein